MTIQFRCQCGRAYQVADDWAGRGVKCNQCGKSFRIPSPVQADPLGDLAQLEAASAPMAPLPVPAPQTIPPSPFPGARRSKSRLPTVLKIVLPLAGSAVLLILLLLAVVARVGKLFPDPTQPTVTAKPEKQTTNHTTDRQSANRTQQFDNKYAPTRDPFATPPANDKVIVTNENWTPDPKRLAQLHAPTAAGPFTIRLPKGFVLDQQRKNRANLSWTRLNSNTGKNDVIGITYYRWKDSGKTPEGTLKLAERGLETDNDPNVRSLKYMRGQYRGISAYSVFQKYQAPSSGNEFLNIVTYHIFFRDWSCAVDAVIHSPPGSDEYELINTAILSLHRR